MTSYLGVDWAGSAWVVIKIGTEVSITTEPAFLNVWHEHGKNEDVKSILVDIPIGLPESGIRACDEEAMNLLRNRRSTIFSIPSRDVVETDDYWTARDENGGSLGSQSWWLFPRIREVDVFLQENEKAREKVYEGHPEICFRKLQQNDLASKTSEVGREQRLSLLEQHDPRLHEKVRDLVDCRSPNSEWHHRISKGKIDDVVDAAVLALTARVLDLGPRSTGNNYPSFPFGEAESDPRLGIEMQIIYPSEQ